MLFCKSSTVKVGTIALICTASCVVAAIASFCFVVFIRRLAGRARIFKRGRCEKNVAARTRLVAHEPGAGGLGGSITRIRQEAALFSTAYHVEGTPMRLKAVLLVSLGCVAVAALSAAPRHTMLMNRLGPSAMTLYIASGDGSGERPLFQTSGFDYNASFSPDGRRIGLPSD